MKYLSTSKNIINTFIYHSTHISLLPLFLFLNCFSLLKPPPITFTQTQTAAERQMVGEIKEIDSDGWLLSSIKTSAIGPVEWKKDKIEDMGLGDRLEEYKILSKILMHTTPEIKRLKELKFVGENILGNLSILEEKRDKSFDKVYPKKEDKKRLIELVQLVNETRNKFSDLIKNSKLKGGSQDYRKTVEYGEYYEEKRGVWILKE
jgi:hypothetical protein